LREQVLQHSSIDSAFGRITRSVDVVVSLRDNFTQEILHEPVRGRLCKHVDCFELIVYLERWHIHGGKCELCNEVEYVNSLHVDLNLQSFCREAGVKDSGHEFVVLSPSGALRLINNGADRSVDLDMVEVEDRPIKLESGTTGGAQDKVRHLQIAKHFSYSCFCIEK
jgi:hypothetical protein